MDTPAVRRLTRSSTNRHLGGVAGGLGHYLGIDPVLIRIAFVAIALAGGAGVLCYIAAWILIPLEEEDSPSPPGAGLSPEAARVAGVGFLALAGLTLVGGWDWAGELVIPVLLLLGGAWLLLRPRPTPGTAPPPPIDDGWPSDHGSDPGSTSASASASASASDAGDVVTAAPPLGAPGRSPMTRLTIGVVCLVAGGLGALAAAGVGISLRAGLLVCLAITAVGLIVGSFTGGARGLIALAVLLTLSVSAVSVLQIPFGDGVGSRRYEPAQPDELLNSYQLTAGELVLDLTGLEVTELDRRTSLAVRLGVGSVSVRVPEGVGVEVDARVTAGDVWLFDRQWNGTDIAATAERPAEEGAPVLVLTIDATLAEVRVR